MVHRNDRFLRPARGSTAAGRDLDEIAASDEAAASVARARLRAVGLTPLDTDETIARLLRPGEQVFERRSPALVTRRLSPEGPIAPPPLRGDLYLTSERLILVGPSVLEADLQAIEEAVIARDQLLLVMHDGVGLLVEVEEPRLMRVQLAAVRAVARAAEPGVLGRASD